MRTVFDLSSQGNYWVWFTSKHCGNLRFTNAGHFFDANHTFKLLTPAEQAEVRTDIYDYAALRALTARLLS